MDGLIGRDHDEGVDLVSIRGFRHELGPQDVIPDRFPGLPLEHRHMLVGSRMEHNLWPYARKYIIDRYLLSHITQHGLER